MRASKYSEFAFFIVLFLAAFSKSIAVAGDYADRKILGFSPDGHYFAYEQYGVQDGSGFPYSEIFVIDALADKWVTGTPVRKRIDDENATLGDVRSQALQEAGPILSKLEISERGEHLASNPRGEAFFPRPRYDLGYDNERVRADQVTINLDHRFTPPKQEPITFFLDAIRLPSGECETYSEVPIRGISLSLKRGHVIMTDELQKRWPTMDAKEKETYSRIVTLVEDKSLPKSRNCPQGYAIADILSHGSGGKTVYAVLFHMQTPGFEGPDSRFHAITHICSTPDCGVLGTP